MLGTLGRTAYRRRRLVLCVWLFLGLAGFGIGSGVFSHLKDSNGVSSAESVRGANALHDGSEEGPGMLVVVTGAEVRDPAVRAAVRTVAARIAQEPFVQDVATGHNAPNAGLVSADGQTTVLAVHTRTTTDMAAVHMQVDQVRSIVRGAVPGASVTVGGDMAVMRDEMASSESDLVRGELIALPILLLALL